jgi:hypothetical protein
MREKKWKRKKEREKKWKSKKEREEMKKGRKREKKWKKEERERRNEKRKKEREEMKKRKKDRKEKKKGRKREEEKEKGRKREKKKHIKEEREREREREEEKSKKEKLNKSKKANKFVFSHIYTLIFSQNVFKKKNTNTVKEFNRFILQVWQVRYTNRSILYGTHNIVFKQKNFVFTFFFYKNSQKNLSFSILPNFFDGTLKLFFRCHDKLACWAIENIFVPA